MKLADNLAATFAAAVIALLQVCLMIGFHRATSPAVAAIVALTSFVITAAFVQRLFLMTFKLQDLRKRQQETIDQIDASLGKTPTS